MLEAKWIGTKANVPREYVEQVLEKKYTPPRGYRLSFYLVISKEPTQDSAPFGSQRFALGAGAFTDAGRVWYELKSNPDLDGDGLGLKFGVGGGPQVLWGKSVLIRLDVAYSPDADPVGVYLEVGRTF